MEISTVLSITLTFVSMIVGFFIAYRQGKELNNSKEITTKTFSISEETKSIAEKLSTNRMVTERVQKIFLLDPKGGEPCSNYRISYPVKYDNRPLPFINQGDFYAIHILSLALGMNNVELRELEPGKDESSIKGNIIFICGPQSNTILNKLYPFASTIKNNDETYVEEFKKGHQGARQLLESWAHAEWFKARPVLPQELKLTVFKVPGETNTDDLSPASENKQTGESKPTLSDLYEEMC